MTTSAIGSVRVVPPGGRPRSQPFTKEELEILKKNPYAHLDEVPIAPAVDPPPAAPDPPPADEKPVESIIPFQKTEEEIDDPFGLKSKAKAHTRELLKEAEEEQLDSEKK